MCAILSQPVSLPYKYRKPAAGARKPASPTRGRRTPQPEQESDSEESESDEEEEEEEEEDQGRRQKRSGQKAAPAASPLKTRRQRADTGTYHPLSSILPPSWSPTHGAFPGPEHAGVRLSCVGG